MCLPGILQCSDGIFKGMDWKANANWKAKIFAAKGGVALLVTKVGKCTITYR